MIVILPRHVTFCMSFGDDGMDHILCTGSLKSLQFDDHSQADVALTAACAAMCKRLAFQKRQSLSKVRSSQRSLLSLSPASASLVDLAVDFTT